MQSTTRRSRLRPVLEETAQLALEEHPPEIVLQHIHEHLIPALHESILVHGPEGTVDELVSEAGDETLLYAPHLLAATYLLGGRELMHRVARRLIEHFPDHANYIADIARTITHVEEQLREKS